MALLVTVYCDHTAGDGSKSCPVVASLTNPRTQPKMAMPHGWGRVSKGSEEYHYCPKHSLKWRDVDVVLV